ncbi:YceI family protein [uncultured Tessaracoccus sp.]|uniref:YceI family protein n=1 Tax=uncultured Tessaracoccus sp. TaxID=905023 RepID=UPI0025D8E64B|nr:YceI family protein [uncultured Tessaracoccus sp.]
MALQDLRGTFVLDPTHTTISFVTRHAMVTKVRGSFEEFEGQAVVGDDPHLEVTVQVASVNTRNDDRDKHLRTSDFFDVEQYPTMKFVANEYEIKDDVVEITGDLTIKDVTKRITIPFEYQGEATDVYGNKRVGLEGGIQVKRSDYGLTWNAALETGGVMVSDKVNLEFDVSAIQQD